MKGRDSYSGPMLLCFVCWIFLNPSHLIFADDTSTTSFSCDDESLQTPPQPLARRNYCHENSAHLIGLFDVHEGNRCHLLRPGGMEQVLMTIAVFENRLMKFDNNDSQIGFEIYDTCSSPSTSLHNLIYALMNARVLLPSCSNRWYVGVIGPKNSEIQVTMRNFLKSIDIPYIPLASTTMKEEITAITEVLAELKWKMVAVFSSTKSLLDEFHSEADKHNICIASSMVLLNEEKTDTFLRMKFQEMTSSVVQVAIILGSGINLREMYEMALATNSSVQYWLLAGVDAEDDLLPILFSPDHPVILFRKVSEQVPVFDSNLEEAYEFSEKVKRLNLVQSYVEYMNSCRKDADGNVVNDTRCTDQLRHTNLQKNMVEESMDQLFSSMMSAGVLQKYESNETKKPLIIEEFQEKPSGIEIWTYQHARMKFAKHKEILVGHYNNGHLNWDKKTLNIFRSMGSGWFKIPEFYCQFNCRETCENFENISLLSNPESLFNRIYHWKHETWVNILLTISCVGTLLALLTAVFLIVNSCREDFDEGSQLSNVILLISVIFSYSCTILFMFHKDSVTCYKRLTIVGLAYASMLAPVLARCFLLIAAEMDGIHSHVSGFLHGVIYFFIMAVQISMATYYWISHLNIKNSKLKCIFEVKSTLGYLSYPMLLSFIWMVASPFCIRSRRNNKEGLLLCFGSIAVCLVWVIWYLLFFILHSRWNEFTICFGLVATATAILIVIFIPKMYKIIVSTAAKEHGQVSMQPVIFASTSSRSPNISIYESVNHGFNPDKDGFVVDVFRDEDDSPRPKKMTHL